MTGIGATYADAIQAWPSRAHFAPDASLVGDMTPQDTARILDLKQQIKALENQMAQVAERSAIACRLASISGYGDICTAELAGEIGTLERFRNEASMAFYLGMASLDNRPGKFHASKPLRHVHARAKAAMMIALDHHRKPVPRSQRYYE